MNSNQVSGLYECAKKLHETITRFRQGRTRKEQEDMLVQIERLNGELIGLLQPQVRTNNQVTITHSMSIMASSKTSEIAAPRPALIAPGDQRIRIVALGNPGVGKSTFLSCLACQPTFRSGLSYGTGLTKSAAVFAIQDRLLIDTPGLCDMAIEKSAAMEITSVFRSGGRFQLLFFVRLEAGRLVTDDLITLTRVMDSLRGEYHCQFTVVINNILPNMYNKLTAGGEELEMVMRGLGSLNHMTSNVILNPFNPQLNEQECMVADLPDEVTNAVVNAPIIELTPSQVADIDTSDYRSEAEALRERIQAKRMEIERIRAAKRQLQQPEQTAYAHATSASRQIKPSTAQVTRQHSQKNWVL